ncbi:hypothetical protein ACTJIJ_12140 [Niabella sp. 22666]|uniref:hypothetical protein n=1 Tax=Niabella sp. 22666 TaxID=3453954 RepID=UPI003F85DF75
MKRPGEYQPVNWINGMKINKTHFIAERNAGTYQQAMGNNSFLNDHNYGILPFKGNTPSSKIWLSIDNANHVNIRIMSCLAITRGGYIIDFNSDEIDLASPLSAKIPGLSIPFSLLKDKSKSFYIVLSVDPYNPEPTGAANPEEQPVRLPFLRPAYSVLLLEEEETSVNTLGDFQLSVGKLEVRDQTVLLVENYIPACTSVNSHEFLLQHHAQTEQFLGKLELNALQIIQKILQKNQSNDIIEPVRKLCEQVLSYISNVYGTYRQTVRYAPPIQLIAMVSGLARNIKNAIDIYAGTSKEEMINYFTEWCNVKQGELEDEIAEVCNYRYDHLNIHAGILKCSNFCGLILGLFDALAALDYIGKKKETGIFVKEQLIVPEEDIQSRRRGFFLAD